LGRIKIYRFCKKKNPQQEPFSTVSGGISNLNAQVHRLPSQQDFFQQKATVLVSHGWKTAPSGSPVERLVGQLSLLCSTPDKK
jgi:hypothetical protein